MSHKQIIHLESLVVLLLILIVYGINNPNWMLFILLFFVPDIAMLGYLFGNKIGAIVYNVFHTYIISVIMVIIGLGLNQTLILSIGLIWTGHIAMDRMLGFGLKDKSFQSTHLQKLS